MRGAQPQAVRCSGTALSWLVLEQRALGELTGARLQEVDAHLDGCPACRACLEQIRADVVELPELPALPAAPELPASGAGAPGTRRAGWWRRRRLSLAAAAAAAAVAALVYLGLPKEALQPAGALPPARIGFKGGELALTLVRRRGEQVVHAPRTFAPGDRFKAQVTCAPDQRLAGELIVYQGRERDLPLPPAAPLSCGNRAPMAGAFTITDEAPVIICLVVQQGTAPLDRAALRRTGPGGLPEGRSVCVRLTRTR